MTPRTRRTAIVFCALGLGLLAHGHRTAAQDKQPAKPAEKPADKAPAKLTDRLAQKVSIEKRIDAPFKEVVAMLADKYDLPLIVDRALTEPGAGACDDDTPIKLPRLLNVRLDTVLRLVCEQVKGAFLVYPDHVKLVPAAGALYESGTLVADPNDPETTLLPTDEMKRFQPLTKKALVNAGFAARPLAEVLDEIAAATGANVILDPKAADAGKQAVSVRFANTPVDAAVRTLCEMADLGVIEDANVLLVTTKERAAARAKADDEKRRAKAAEGAGIGILGGIDGIGGGLARGFGGAAPGPDLAAEVAKLKDQTDQLKKQIEELKKMPKK